MHDSAVLVPLVKPAWEGQRTCEARVEDAQVTVRFLAQYPGISDIYATEDVSEQNQRAYYSRWARDMDQPPFERKPLQAAE